MIRSSRAFLAVSFAFFTACGGSAPPPADATSTTTVTPPSPSSTAAKETTPPPAETAKPAETAAASTTPPADAPPKDDKRLEDMKMKKTTSAGGSYAVNVVAAKGLAPEDVVRTIGTKPDDCYAKLFKKQLNANGKTTMEITITAKGKTGKVTVKSDDLKDAELVKCIQKVVKSLDWGTVDKAGAKTTVDFAVAGQ